MQRQPGPRKHRPWVLCRPELTHMNTAANTGGQQVHEPQGEGRVGPSTQHVAGPPQRRPSAPVRAQAWPQPALEPRRAGSRPPAPVLPWPGVSELVCSSLWPQTLLDKMGRWAVWEWEPQGAGRPGRSVAGTLSGSQQLPPPATTLNCSPALDFWGCLWLCPAKGTLQGPWGPVRAEGW